MAICEYILATALKAAEKADAKKIITLNISAGAMRGIKEEFMNFSFSFISKSTIAEGARLKIETVDITALCKDCQNIFTVEEFKFVCPNCSSSNIDSLTGMELILKDIEIE